MKENFFILALIFPIIVLGTVMGYHARSVLFDKVEIAATGYDPRDVLAGHYLNLRLNWEKTDCSQFADGICPKDEFDSVYNFYVGQQNASTLEAAVNDAQNMVKLIFSYRQGQKPQLSDMLINGRSYKKIDKKVLDK